MFLFIFPEMSTLKRKTCFKIVLTFHFHKTVWLLIRFFVSYCLVSNFSKNVPSLKLSWPELSPDCGWPLHPLIFKNIISVFFTFSTSQILYLWQFLLFLFWLTTKTLADLGWYSTWTLLWVIDQLSVAFSFSHPTESNDVLQKIFLIKHWLLNRLKTDEEMFQWHVNQLSVVSKQCNKLQT